MNKVFVFVLLFAVSCLAQDAWRNFLVVDCNGGVHLTPNFGLTSTYVDLHHLLDEIGGVYKDRVQSAIKDCTCSGLSEADFRKLFWIPSLDWILNRLRGNSGSITAASCSNLAAVEKFLNDSFNDAFEVNLPSTCTYDSWVAGTPCTGRFNIPGTSGMSVDVMVDRCPNKWFPFISVTCNGAACDSFLKPCASNADCAGGTKCSVVYNSKEQETCSYDQWGNRYNCNYTRTEEPVITTADDVFQALKEINVYDDGDTSPGCRSGDVLFSTLINYIKGYFDTGNLGTVSTLKLCTYDTPGSFNTNDFGLPDLIEQYPDNYVNCTEGPIMTTGYMFPTGGETSTTYRDEYCKIHIGQLTSWDGMLSNPSEAANSADRKNGVGLGAPTIQPVNPINSDAMVLAHLSCDGQVSLLPNHDHFSTIFRVPFKTTAEFLVNQNSLIQTCRAAVRSSSLSSDAFKYRFAPFLDFFLYQLTSPTSPLASLGPVMSDWSFEGVDKKLQMPSTCTHQFWKDFGECRVAYTGFSNLFDNAITLRLKVSQCPAAGGLNPAAVPEVYLECAGVGCSAIEEPRDCSLSSDCPPGSSCRPTDINDWIDDWDADIVGWAINEDAVCHQDWHNRMKKDVRALMRHLQGKTTDNTMNNGYCFLDIDNLSDDTYMQTWADGEVVTVGNLITMPHLVPWELTLPSTTGNGNSTVSASSSVTATVAVSLFAGLLALLF